MTLDETQRATFSVLADVLVPATDQMPAASEVDISGSGLDRVLRARPDLEAPLVRVLADGGSSDPTARIRNMQREDPAGFEALALAATGGYYTEGRVRDLIGYPGQTYDASRVEIPHIDTSDPMLQRVIARGSFYRPTPPSSGEEKHANVG
jgi:hypothetical protein